MLSHTAINSRKLFFYAVIVIQNTGNEGHEQEEETCLFLLAQKKTNKLEQEKRQ